MITGDRAGPSPAGLDILNEIYAVYEEFSNPYPVACKRGCCFCCTQDVTITTLEGRRILQRLHSTQDPQIRQLTIESTRSRPSDRQSFISTNMFARMCLEGQDSPEVNSDRRKKACIFLSETDCGIYSDRPFGCRSFFSTQPCRPDGSAVVDPFLLTVNSVFLQIIEEIDVGGFSGPIDRVLSYLITRCGNPAVPSKLYGHLHGDEVLARNMPIPALMIPPEHQDRIRPIVRRLKTIRDKC